ncbi:hypothetical protein AUEXF2481DRAFT_33961 [Aureobasidium subglaciale EXF-2481]|uniref:Uncharacterized protein n=1 Tax=Aureobasidium subglaciale (strain EXF-2481) TaxID=1043005 RepID=A0A074YUA0_AURSE|nr:uncharacterized protein AUEXF2481DRAFT_33961 [Aureobasidium subglaciale EXF-2481]KEQ90421.1 hypothetical protein AUEXF2481DRAFT_33961 [Aureobasidium subglaciale EXF-2481]
MDTGIVSEPPLWRPVVDGYILPSGYADTLRTGSHNDRPIMTGDNLNETSWRDMNITTYNSAFTTIVGNSSQEFFGAYPASNESEATAQAAAFGNDINRYTTSHWANDWCKGNASKDVFAYSWTKKRKIGNTCFALLAGVNLRCLEEGRDYLSSLYECQRST